MDESSSSDSSDKSFATARENLNSSTESFKSATSDNGCDDSDRVLIVPEGGLSPPLPRASRAAGEDDHGHHQVEEGSDETSLMQVDGDENQDNDDGTAGEDDASARNQVEEDNDASSIEDNDASSMEIDDEGEAEDAEDKEDDGANSADISASNLKRKANETTTESVDQRATKRCRVAPARPAAAAARRRQSRAVKKKSPLKFPPPTGEGARAAAVAASNPDPFPVPAPPAATLGATPAATSSPKPPAAPAPTPAATPPAAPTAKATATATAATKAAPPATTAAPPASTTTATPTAGAPTATSTSMATAPTATSTATAPTAAMATAIAAPTPATPAATPTATAVPPPPPPATAAAAAGGVGGSRGSGYLSSPSSAEKSQDSKECDISLDSVLGTKFIAEDSQDSDNKALSPLIIDKGQNVLKGDFGGGLSPILRVSSPPVSTPKPPTPPFGSARADQQEWQRKRKASTAASKNTRKNDVDESFATDGKRTKTADLPPPTVATVEGTGTRKEGDSFDSLNLSESITSTNSKSQEDHEIGGDSKDGQLDHGEDSTGDDDRNSNTSSKPAKKKSVRFSSPSDGSPWQSGRRSSASSAGLSMSFLGPSSSDPIDYASPSGVERILNQSVHKNTMEELMQTTARRNQQAKQKVLMQQLRQSAPLKDIDYDALSSNKSPSKDDAESGKSESAISTPELNDDARSPKRMASEEKPNDSTPEKPATIPEDELQDKAAAKGENESAEFDGKKAASDEEDASAKDANHEGKTLEEDAAVVTEEDATVDNAKEDNAGDEDAHDGGAGHQEAPREKRRGTKQSSPRNKTSESQTSEKPAFGQEEKGTSTPKWPDHSFPGGDIDGKIGGDSSPTAASKSTRNDDADGKRTKTVTFADDLTKSKSQEDHEIDGVSKDGAASTEDDASKQLVEEQQNSQSDTAETESAPKKMSALPRKDGGEKEEQVEDGTSKPREEDSSEHDNDGEKEDDTASGKPVEEQNNKSATDDDEDDAKKPRGEDALDHDGSDKTAEHGKISEELEGLEVEMPAAESSESSEEKDDAEMPAAESSESSEEKDDAEMPAAESSESSEKKDDAEMPAAESSESSEEKDDAEMPAAESSESSEEKDDAETPAAESSDKEDSGSHDTSRKEKDDDDGKDESHMVASSSETHSLQKLIDEEVSKHPNRYISWNDTDWNGYSEEDKKEERKSAFSADIAAEICSRSAENIRDLDLETLNCNACNDNGESYLHRLTQRCTCYAGKQAREFSQISCAHGDKLEILIELKGASARVRDDNGNTLLHTACKKGSYGVINELLKLTPECLFAPCKDGLTPFQYVPDGSELYNKLKRSIVAAVTQLSDSRCGGYISCPIMNYERDHDGVERYIGNARSCVQDMSMMTADQLAVTYRNILEAEVMARLKALTHEHVLEHMPISADSSGDPSIGNVKSLVYKLGLTSISSGAQDIRAVCNKQKGIYLLLLELTFTKTSEPDDTKVVATDRHCLQLRVEEKGKRILVDNSPRVRPIIIQPSDLESVETAENMIIGHFCKGERQAGFVKKIKVVQVLQIMPKDKAAKSNYNKTNKTKKAKTKTRTDNVQIDELDWAFKVLGGQRFSDAIERQPSNFHELYKNPKEQVMKKDVMEFLSDRLGLPVDGENTPKLLNCLNCEEPGIQVYVLSVKYEIDGKFFYERRALVFQVSKSEDGVKKYLYNNHTRDSMRLLTEDLSTKNGVDKAFEARLPSRLLEGDSKYKHVKTELLWAFKLRNE
ncbi:expressed unknown protein [Seminavis robusta]|uniref:Uncharacterized protein n=1 Tax=Seminavis robusta TaxID=568900 RepID=A0A9N8HTS7_9STRA|nr:expressed unknown protein [Seminavis robusta]|eukprot:Sro1703_g292290.1 n/a (1752) ;mRNA; r:3294-8696